MRIRRNKCKAPGKTASSLVKNPRSAAWGHGTRPTTKLQHLPSDVGPVRPAPSPGVFFNSLLGAS